MDKSNVDNDSVLEIVSKIFETASKLKIPIKMFGSMASYMHILNSGDRYFLELVKTFKSKKALKDLDFIARGKDRGRIKKLFVEELGFTEDFHVNRLHGRRRHIYYSQDGSIHVDVYFDKLEFNHDIEPKEEFKKDGSLLSIPYLLLTKLQITQPTLGDIIDIQILIYLCDRNEKCKSEIRRLYMKYLSDDWGFWYDAYKNIEKSVSYLDIYSEDNLKKEILSSLAEHLKYLEDMDKGKKWYKRAKVGTAKEWYRKIEEPRL